jgi:hypothetical protein
MGGAGVRDWKQDKEKGRQGDKETRRNEDRKA